MSTLFEACRLIKIMLNDHNKILHAYMLHEILGLDDVYILRGKLSKAKALQILKTHIRHYDVICSYIENTYTTL